MALKSFNEISTGKELQPTSELERINYIRANRLLFEANFTELGIVQEMGRVAPLRINWFRRAVQFYGEFMMSDGPIVLVEGNERAQDYYQMLVNNNLPLLQRAIIDVLRFGVANLTIGVGMQLERWEDDQHYIVRDEVLGDYLGDIFIRIRAEQGVLREERINETSFANGYVDVFKCEIGKQIIREVYRYEANSVGQLERRIETATPYIGNVQISQSIGNVSMFDDMKSSVGAISRDVGRLDRVLERNANPHLYGPDGMLQVDDIGRVTIDSEGMFLPMQDGDTQPGYLSWDSDIEAQKFDYAAHERTALVMAGLSPILFDPTLLTGALSGVSLRRTLIPFYAKLLHLSQMMERGIIEWLSLMNFHTEGEIFEGDITIEWPFLSVFDDLTSQSDDDAAEGGTGEGEEGEEGGE